MSRPEARGGESTYSLFADSLFAELSEFALGLTIVVAVSLLVDVAVGKVVSRLYPADEIAGLDLIPGGPP